MVLQAICGYSGSTKFLSEKNNNNMEMHVPKICSNCLFSFVVCKQLCFAVFDFFRRNPNQITINFCSECMNYM